MKTILLKVEFNPFSLALRQFYINSLAPPHFVSATNAPRIYCIAFMAVIMEFFLITRVLLFTRYYLHEFLDRTRAIVLVKG